MRNNRSQFSIVQGLTPIQKKYMLQITNAIYDLPIASDYRVPIESSEFFEKIKKPMDLPKVLDKIKNNEYISVDKWKEDMNLMWKNAQMIYNDQRTSILSLIATEIATVFKQMSDDIPRDEIEEWKYKIKQAHQEIMRIADAKPDAEKMLGIQTGFIRLNKPKHKILLRATSQTIDK